jgi:exopolyphosphatase/guanosine-5'-triphosphate,3'-diphosphate pyrophosphatase
VQTNTRYGIIDIGSNSVRLVIYEQLEGNAYRVIDESKQSERLSSKVEKDGSIPLSSLVGLIDTLNYFQMVCDVHNVSHIRAVATAAIRNAINSDEIILYLNKQTGVHIEVLSGQMEAYLGFVGVMNAMNIQDGYVVDIGGGSTEVSLFVGRELLHSISFPFGAVNMAKQYCKDGEISTSNLALLRKHVEQQLTKTTWLKSKSNLPVIGLGGSFRSLAKINQRGKQYSLPLTHQYEMTIPEVEVIIEQFLTTPFEKRKRINGLAKDRADIIVPGVIILQTILNHVRANQLVISGSGLRDGVYQHTRNPNQPINPDVVGQSVMNLLANHTAINVNHVLHVNQLAMNLFGALRHQSSIFDNKDATYLSTAAQLYRIGISIDYYSYQKHTFYLIAFSRLFGLNHREKLMCALIASFKSKSQMMQLASPYKDILSADDLSKCILLGSLLQLAIALDRSETQPIANITCTVTKKDLTIMAEIKHAITIEQRELSAISQEFNKAWTLRPTLSIL